VRQFAALIAALLFAIAGNPQEPSRPKVPGIGLVVLDSSNPDILSFYSALKLHKTASPNTGHDSEATYSVNGDQRLRILTHPWQAPQTPDPRVAPLRTILFRTTDISAMHDYLKAKGVLVGPIVPGVSRMDSQGRGITDGSLGFTLVDTEGDLIGFIEREGQLPYHLEAGQTGTRLIHAGFIMLNRAATEHFYKDILGFRPYWQGGMKDDQTDWLDLQVPDGTDWVEFMLNVPADADKRTLGVMNHIALGVPDIHAAYKQLLTNGMKLTEEPKIGRDGKWQLNLYDPDQTRVEMMEFTPVEKPCCSEYTGLHPKP
jgi:catechol 2,3-dioxygenase-like lactoylglutathione lyase family enzyme